MIAVLRGLVVGILLASETVMPRLWAKAYYSRRPGEISIEVRHTRNEFDAALMVWGYYDGFFLRSSVEELQGLKSSPLHLFVWRGLPREGLLEIEARIIDAEGQEAGSTRTGIFLR